MKTLGEMQKENLKYIEEKPVNEFYTWLLGAEKVNEILHDYCKDVATEEDIRNFFMAGDTELLEDFLRKKFNV